jgi:hypothetical protein
MKLKTIALSVAMLAFTACGKDASQTSTVSSSETKESAELPLAELDISEILHSYTANGLEVKVTFEVQPCRYEFVGVHLEDIPNTIRAITTIKVRALAKDNGFACKGVTLQKTSTVTLTPVIAGSYDFIK